MARLRRILGIWLAVAAWAAGAAVARTGQDAHWPVRGEVRGEVSGEVKMDALPALGLTWRLEAGAAGLTARASRSGLNVEVALQPGRDGHWNWEVRKAMVDLAEMWPLLRERVGASAVGWSVSGRAEVSGRGSWSAQGGPIGELRLKVREGWARSDALNAELSGVELDVVVTDLATGTLASGQLLRVAKISVGGAEAGEVKVEFGLGADRVLRVGGGEARLLGGSVRLRPFTLALAAPALEATAEVDALQLGEAARLVPWLLNTAQGKLRGRIEVAWDAAKGLRVRDGGLDIVKADDASFRLSPSPGLLTGGMPRKYGLLPWGWARWVAVENPAYAPLKDIEMGREGLRIETFQVEFWPDGPGRGRTASVQIVGRPTSGKWVREVKLDLNFHGPWSEFLAFGLNNDLSGFSFRLE